MAKQQATSINIDVQTAEAIDSRRRDGETRTARLAADLGSYHRLLDAGLRRARLALSPAEVSLILDVFNGTPEGQAWDAGRVTARVADGIALDGLAEKWGVRPEALLGKLAALGDLPTIALADWTERVWDKGDFDITAETAIFRGE